ncbi:hypothetical protein SEA_JONJAMES_159 [Gordonia Phage JonJames]|nr:hypothetical protein SEA_JONJAMES_159 [Gordonia Phage JonJames]
MTSWEPWDGDIDVPVTVCIIHKRFIPCRRTEPMCELSSTPEDVEMVRKYQQG